MPEAIMNQNNTANEIVTVRVFAAPRELVWKAWTEPEHITRWWGPRGFTNTIHEMEVRPGGAWVFVMHGPDGIDYENKYLFREVVRPERLVYTHLLEPSFEASATFEELGNKTCVTMRTRFASAAMREEVATKFGAVEGAIQTLARLEEFVLARQSYAPGAALNASVHGKEGRYTLVCTRDFSHAPQRVWQALTEPKALREWTPFDATRALSSVGPVTLLMAGGTSPQPLEATVLRSEAPWLLEYTWGTDLLSWELTQTDSGTRLTLRHTIETQRWLPKVAAGWHLCLDVADLSLQGKSIGRIVGAEARSFGWERLNAEYAALFGVEDTGWPEGVEPKD
jgi:uncharacterized protein YndB with AHSA1/START domain